MGSTSDKRQKLLPTNDKTRKKIPITGTWTDIIYFFFQKEEYIVFLQIYHKTRVLKSVCRAYENFYKATRLVLHITCEKCLD